jgi:MarR family transcriptional regulator, lower aerobic nicotinate degradation pathway regulator
MEAERALGSLTGSAGYLLSRVGTAVQQGFKELLGTWQIRPQHFAILTALSATGSASQRELCRPLGIDSGNMVELVDVLEALGYAQRRRDPGDRRRYLITMTAQGHTAFAAMTEAVSDFATRFLEPLDQTEQTALISALTKLYAATAEGRRLPPRPEPAGRRQQ